MNLLRALIFAFILVCSLLGAVICLTSGHPIYAVLLLLVSLLLYEVLSCSVDNGERFHSRRRDGNDKGSKNNKRR